MFDEKHREVFKYAITASVIKSHHNPFNRVSESIPPS